MIWMASHAYPLNTLGGVLDAIVTEWAEMTVEPEQSEDKR